MAPDDASLAQLPLWRRFSFKLTIAILAIVAVVTLGLLTLMQTRINAAYREFVEDRFNDEIRAFEEQFNFRRQTIEQSINQAALAVKPRVAMLEGDIGKAYFNFAYELEAFQYLFEAESPRAFFRVFNVEQEILSPVERNAGAVAGMDDARLHAKLKPYLVEPMEGHWYNVGYLSFPTPDEPTLYEVFIVPVIDDYYQELVGWLAVGLKLDEEALGKASMSIKSGVLADGHLFSSQIPAGSAESILPLLIKAAEGDPQQYQLEGRNYLLFGSIIEHSPSMPKALRVQLYSLAGLEGLVDRIRTLAIYFLIGALLLGLALSYFTSQSFSHRIEQLVGVMGRIGQGDFDVDPPKGEDELGQLSSAIKEAAEGLAQKEKIHQVLNMVTDPAVADEMLAGKIELGGETREVATLFCDIRGFTPLTDGMDPREVVDLVNKHMGAMSDLAEKHKGVVDKYVGDEIMVLFGAPHAYGDDWVNAVRCGLAMCAIREKLNEGIDRPINIGVGIGAGEVVAGRMGSDRRRNYTVLGDRVNLAARLCSKAGPGEVIIDEAIRNRLPETAVTERIDSVQLKGFKDPVPVFKVISVD